MIYKGRDCDGIKIVRRYDANGNVIEDKDLERFRLDSPVVRQILYQMNKEMGSS